MLIAVGCDKRSHRHDCANVLLMGLRLTSTQAAAETPKAWPWSQIWNAARGNYLLPDQTASRARPPDHREPVAEAVAARGAREVQHGHCDH